MLKMSILGEDGSVTIEKDGVKVVVTAIDGGLLISTTQENFYHQPIAEVDNGKVTVFTEYAKLGKYKEKP